MLRGKAASPESTMIVRDALMQLMDVCFPTIDSSTFTAQSTVQTKTENKQENKDIIVQSQGLKIAQASKSDQVKQQEQALTIDVKTPIPHSLISKIKEKFIVILKPETKTSNLFVAQGIQENKGPITSFKCEAYKLAHMFRSKFSFNIGHIFSFSHKAFAAEVGHDELSEIVNHPDVLRVEHDYIMTIQGFRALGDDVDVKLQHPSITPKIVGQQLVKSNGQESKDNILARLKSGSGLLKTVSASVSTTATSYQNQQTVPWGIAEIGAPNSTQPKHAGKPVSIDNVEVFVIDTGIQTTHPDLNVVESKSFVATETFVAPRNFHGQHVAGSIGAKDNTTGVVGVAPGVRLHSIKVLDSSGSGSLSWVMAGVDYVTQYKRQNPTKAVVANLSVGFYTGTTSFNAIDEAIANAVSAGVIMVIAAGNDGREAMLASPAHVAASTSAITVGSYGRSRRLSSFSNRGPAVTVFAPGEGILSTWADGGYSKLSGSSMSTPHVAGLCALYLSKYPNATPVQVKQAIISTSRSNYVTGCPKGTTTLAGYNKFYD